MQRGGGDDAAERRVGVLDHRGEGRGDDKVRRIRRLGEGAGDLVEELRADDAAGAPDFGDRRHRQVPVIFLRGGGHHGKALRIGADLAGEKRAFQILDEGGLVGNREGGHVRQAEDFFSRFTLALERRDGTGGNGGLDAGRRHTHVLGFDGGPFSRALLAGLVEDHVDHRATGNRVLGGQHLCRNLDEVGFEAALVPLGKDVGNLRRAHLQAVAKDAVDLGDHLHVGIFDAVMDGLDEVAGAVFAEPGDARIVVVLGGDRGQHLLDALPGGFRAADHDGGAVARALFTAGNAHADEGQARILQRIEAAHRIAEVGIAGIDHDVVVFEVRAQQFHLLVHGRTGLDHDDDRARRADGGDELFDRLAGHDLALEVAGLLVEFLGARDRAVEHRDRVALLGNVERKVRSHNTETDKPDFRLCHVHTSVGWRGGGNFPDLYRKRRAKRAFGSCAPALVFWHSNRFTTSKCLVKQRFWNSLNHRPGRSSPSSSTRQAAPSTSSYWPLLSDQRKAPRPSAPRKSAMGMRKISVFMRLAPGA